MARKQYSITAIIYDKRGRVLSIGKNSYQKTHTLQYKYAMIVGLPHKTFLHAEISAIVKCKDLKRAHKISVFRYGEQGEPLKARPCPICMSCIIASGIEHIEYTTGEENGFN